MKAQEKTVAVPREDYDDLIKTLNWVNDNPGIHPKNVEHQVLALRKKFVVNSPTRDVD